MSEHCNVALLSNGVARRKPLAKRLARGYGEARSNEEEQCEDSSGAPRSLGRFEANGEEEDRRASQPEEGQRREAKTAAHEDSRVELRRGEKEEERKRNERQEPPAAFTVERASRRRLGRLGCVLRMQTP